MLPPELREMQTNYGLILSAKHLKVQGRLGVILSLFVVDPHGIYEI